MNGAPRPTPAPEGSDAQVLPPVQVRARRPSLPDTIEGRATHQVGQEELRARQPRSTPQALQFAPGVYVQQTAHGQGSPYVRGLTGRRTLLLFDGLPLNNALFRQGPNQYLFTVDARSLDRIEVLRGSASVELGAGAMGGAILLHPTEPRIAPRRDGLHLSPAAELRATTADDELGGRVQLDAQLGRSTGVLVGAGARRVRQLEAAGPIEGLRPFASEEERLRKEVPRFEDDGRTQMGTGFDEVTADARVVHRLSKDERLTAAIYLYRQYDSPRTDQCPPPEAPDDWCLTYEQQFRTQAYASAQLAPGLSLIDRLDVALGFLRQHERRSNAQVFVNEGEDDLDAESLRVAARTRKVALGERLALELLYGFDGSLQQVRSEAWQIIDFSRMLPDSTTVVTRDSSRGQYMDGSDYGQGGLWASARLHVGERLTLRLGGRAAAAQAESPADEESDTLGVDSRWFAAVGHAGATCSLTDELTLLGGLEQGFRPPNLDDLTARQLTGQGFQMPNPELRPERSLTAELGGRYVTRHLRLEAWVFQTWGRDWMDRRDAECPPAIERECQATRWAPPVQLVNLDETAIIRGAELEARVRLPARLRLRGTLSYAWGEAESPLAHEDGQTRPLSRIPPLNGTGELTWSLPTWGLQLGAALRWAAGQDRLSFGDENDKRIPPGGTPGYAVADLRAGWERRDLGYVRLALENLLDSAYRVHGSSINGAGRGLVLTLGGRL